MEERVRSHVHRIVPTLPAPRHPQHLRPHRTPRARRAPPRHLERRTPHLRPRRARRRRASGAGRDDQPGAARSARGVTRSAWHLAVLWRAAARERAERRVAAPAPDGVEGVRAAVHARRGAAAARGRRGAVWALDRRCARRQSRLAHVRAS